MFEKLLRIIAAWFGYNIVLVPKAISAELAPPHQPAATTDDSIVYVDFKSKKKLSRDGGSHAKAPTQEGSELTITLPARSHHQVKAISAAMGINGTNVPDVPVVALNLLQDLIEVSREGGSIILIDQNGAPIRRLRILLKPKKSAP